MNSIHMHQLSSEMKCVCCFTEDTSNSPKVKPPERKCDFPTSSLNKENLNLQQEAGGNSKKLNNRLLNLFFGKLVFVFSICMTG